VNCTECRPILHAYVDDELAARDALEMEAHLASCSACASRHRTLRELSQAVREHASRFAPTSSFEARLRSSLPGTALPADLPRIRAPRRLAMASAVAAAIVLAALGGAWWGRPSATTRLGDEVVALHSRALVSGHLTDVVSSDRHTVNPWFQGKVPFAPGARDFATQGFALEGGRLDYLYGQPVAAIVYRKGPHAVELFVWPAGVEGDSDVKRLAQRGYSIRVWTQDGLNHAVIADTDENALSQLVELLRARG
jgi:anti-sigma factor RsiW